MKEVAVVSLLTNEATNTAGDSKRLGLNKSFQVSGTWAGTTLIEVSNDGTNWNIIISTTANGDFENSGAWLYVRARRSVATSGNVTVVAGYAE